MSPFKKIEWVSDKSYEDGRVVERLGGTCPKCGKLYALVGRIHRCVAAESPVEPAEELSGSSGPKETSLLPTAPIAEEKKSAFNRTRYQREYMRKYLPLYRKRKKHDREKEGRPGG